MLKYVFFLLFVVLFIANFVRGTNGSVHFLWLHVGSESWVDGAKLINRLDGMEAHLFAPSPHKSTCVLTLHLMYMKG